MFPETNGLSGIFKEKQFHFRNLEEKAIDYRLGSLKSSIKNRYNVVAILQK